MPSMDDKSTIYSKACDAFSRKDYEEALELFTELNGWLDSKEKAQACQIRIANPDYDNIIRQQQEKACNSLNLWRNIILKSIRNFWLISVLG